MKNIFFAGLIAAIIASSVFSVQPSYVWAQATPTFQKLDEARIDHVRITTSTIPTSAPKVFREVISTENIFIDADLSGAVTTQPLPNIRHLPLPNSQMPQKIEIQAQRIKTVTEKLAILADAILEQRVRGLAKLKMDKFMSEFLTASAVELSDWLYDTETDKDFQKLFHKPGPWYLVFLAMSPTSMDEAMDGVDMPGLPNSVMEAKKLPIKACVKSVGENLIVEIWGAYDLSLTFKIDKHNKVQIIG